MILTFLPEYLRSFFGDNKYIITPDMSWYDIPNRYDKLDTLWNWGWRHYLYFCMCIILFIIQIFKIGNWIRDTKF